MLLLVAPAGVAAHAVPGGADRDRPNASFAYWALYNPKKTWVGLDHYYAVISDPAFLYVVLPNTFLS